MKTGKLIVIDGGDGSGKTVQANLLLSYLKDQGIKTMYVDFPQYDTFYGDIVARFLRGEFGEITQVSPYLASLAYALDRSTMKQGMEDHLAKGGYIVANRYVSSNLAHQGCKFDDPAKRDEYIHWDLQLEYDVHKIPKEDIVIYLDVPVDIGMKLTARKGTRAYLKGGSDIHEKNSDYLKKVRSLYTSLASTFKGWVTVPCTEDGQIMTEQAIHTRVIDTLRANGIL